ncbi:MAG: hypothetical protein M3336_11670 [Chloroflexota bacterium]|nr:hypothetical protein [Chloroflexota bacterium]
MSQINVNTPPTGVEPVETSGDRTAAAGINLITVLIVLGVLAIIAWYLFTGPLRSMTAGGSSTTVNVNPAPTTVNINPPSAPNPAQGSNTGGSTTNQQAPANNAPSKP